MTCPRCAAENPPDARTCARCGAPLSGALTAEHLERLRRYLPPALADALQTELAAPPARLIDQCLTHLAGLAETTAAYLPADLLLQLARDPVPGRADGRYLEGTLLFADISGFTAMSEKLSRTGREGAEEITAVVNRYLDVMITHLHAHGGQLMKFGGDALLGLFREPYSAASATRAALGMQAGMAEFAETRTSQGVFPLRMKVGLHRGRFFAAQLGDAQALEYALFGADVNATAAAESAAQAGQVLVDAPTLAALAGAAQTQPSATAPGYFVVQQITAAPPAPAAAQLTDPFLFTRSANGLRRAAQLLDALTPYLPAGLLGRLVLSAGALGFEGEHRLVAALFANVHGLGALADRLGPGREAEVTAALNGYFLGVAQAVRAYDGIINKIDLYDHGDKLVVLFGAPVAHEDDAERAVRAALQMQAALADPARRAAFGETDLRQHIGVNFGNVFAGYVGTRRRREYSVIGDEVNLAARLMSVAGAGEIVAAQTLHRKLGPLFRFTPRGEVRLKGKSAPVPILTVDGARSAEDAAVAAAQAGAALRAPLVGRAAEWARLMAFAETLRAGQGAILSVLGEAGLGKTRLVDDFQAAVSAAAGPGEPAPLRQAEGRCLSYTESVSYAPFQELMRQLIGAPANADEAALWERLRATSQALPAEAAADHLPFLANFLNLHLDADGQARLRYLDAEARQRRTFAAIAALVEALARSGRPLLLILEDIHWIDQASRALVEYLLALTARAPVGLLLVYRPERTKVCWQIREKAAREYPAQAGELELSPLPAPETRDLLERLAPGAQWPAEFQQLILTQTEGNPLYLEELLRVLIDTGVLARGADNVWRVEGALDTVQVPDTLEGVMMTRLDRLDEPSRNTAQVASVIGRSFTSEVLKHATDGREDAELQPHLFQLQEHEITSQTQPPPERVYTFIHGMMQDVAYGSLLARIRRQVHRRIAEYLQGRSGADEGLYPVVARHAFLGQDWPTALRYQMLAGQQAQRLFANNEALDHFTKALQSAEALPAEDTAADRLAIHLALGELNTVTAKYDRAAEQLTEALRLAGEAGDAEAQARACRWQARVNELKGDYAAALEWTARGLTALAGQETAEAAELALIRGLIHVRQGDYEAAGQRAHLARRIAEAAGDPRTLGRAENLLGVTELRNHPRGAVEHFQSALALYRQAGDLQGQANTSNLMANAYFKLGQRSAAAEAYRGARVSFEQLGDVYRSAFALNNLAGVARDQGQLDDAQAYYLEARARLERISASAAVRGVVEMNLGDTYLRRPDVAPAFTHLRAAHTLFEQSGSRDFLPELHRHLARAALLAGDLKQADAEVTQALALADELNMRSERGSALRVLGELDLSRGREQAAAEALTESVAILIEVADDYELARSRFALGRALARLNRRAEAVAALGEAGAVFHRLEAELDWRAAEALRVLLDPTP